MALPNGDLITTVFDPQMAYPVDKRMQVDTLNSRDSMSMFVRWEGMEVYVLENKTKYILQGGRSNEFWKELGTGSGTGGTTFVGQFESADLLPTSGRSAGDYAFVGTGDDFVQYNWDSIANEWVMAEGQTDMASEFFHIGYKTPLRRPVIFPLFPKDVLVQESGDFVFAPEMAVARFIFVGEVTAIRGIETASADREIKLVNRTGSDIILRDKASGIPTESGFDFGGTDYTWVNGSEITLKGNGTYWELAPNNNIAFSDHLDSVNAQVSVGSDGLEVISLNIDQNGNNVNYKETSVWYDNTLMNDSKVDGDIFVKARGKYFLKSLGTYENILQKDTMSELYNISSKEILLIQMGFYTGVQLNGYYEKGDTPLPILYILSDTSDPDDQGSVINVGNITISHNFSNGNLHFHYFGLHNGSSDDTARINAVYRAQAKYKGSVVTVPNTLDPFMIDGVSTDSGSSGRGIIIPSNSETVFEEGARWKIKATRNGGYCGVNIHTVENVVFRNPWVIGDRLEHLNPVNEPYIEWEASTYYPVGTYIAKYAFGYIVTVAGTTAPVINEINPSNVNVGDVFTDGTATIQVVEPIGQWGHNIEVHESRNVSFYNLKSDEAWGDGLYIGCTPGNTDRSTHNRFINLYGTSYFNNCRRQGISVISCDDLFIEHAHGTDIQGHDPQAVIDFEPNFWYHSIYNCVVNNVTSIRSRYAVLFASQSNRYGITVNNIIDIDNIWYGSLHFSGLGFGEGESSNVDNYVHIGRYYINKCYKAPVRVTNWYGTNQGSIKVEKIVVDEWLPDVAGEFSIVRFSYTTTGQPNKPIENIYIGDVEINRFTPSPDGIFRPFFMFSSITPLSNNKLKNISINYNELPYPDNLKEDGHATLPVDQSTVNAFTKRVNSDLYKRASETILVKNNDIQFCRFPENNITIVRRGFNGCIIHNVYTQSAIFNIVLGASSGFTTIDSSGIALTGNSFTLNQKGVVKLERISDTLLRVTLLDAGIQNRIFKNGLYVDNQNNIYNGTHNGLTSTESYGIVKNPTGGLYKSTIIQTGSIKVQLPASFGQKMTTVKGTVYDYTNGDSFNFFVSFFTEQSAESATRYTAKIIGSNTQHPIRIYTDGDHSALYIGELSESWNNLNVSIDEVHFSHETLSTTIFEGWSISVVQSFSGTMVGTVLDTFPKSNIPNASTTERGIIEQATDAEIKTGTDTERAVDPKGLKDNYLSYSDRAITSSGTIAITPLTYNVRQETIIFTGTAPITLNGFNAAVSNRNLILVNQTGGTITIPASAGVTVPFAAATTIGDGEVSRFMVYNNLILKEV